MFFEPFYDPAKSYLENFDQGPVGLFATPEIYADPGEPQHEFLGEKVFTPFGIPAGPLLNGAYVKAALDKGFDIPVYKTVRTRKVTSHPWPNVLPVEVEGDLPVGNNSLVVGTDYTEPLSITNSFGVPSFEPDFWQPDMAAAVAYARHGQLVVGSYQGTKAADGSVAGYIADFILGAKLLKETGVKAIEVNLSCPNEGTAALLCFDVERSAQVVAAIKNEIGNLPLLIKIAYFEDDAKLSSLVRATGPLVQGITSINTISAAVRTASGEQALPGEGRLWSGVCGSSIKWAGVAMTRKLFALREKLSLDFAIVGVGGVGSAHDFDEYRRAGADVVMSATAAMWNPQLAQEIKEQAHEL